MMDDRQDTSLLMSPAFLPETLPPAPARNIAQIGSPLCGPMIEIRKDWLAKNPDRSIEVLIITVILASGFVIAAFSLL